MKTRKPIKRGKPPTRSAPPKRSSMPKRSGKIKAKPRTASEFKRVYGSLARVRWMNEQSCVACEGGPCEGHHIVNGGMSKKAHHSLIVPLCDRCHDELHDRGKLTFEAKYRVSLATLAEQTAKAWYELETGTPWHLAATTSPEE